MQGQRECQQQQAQQQQTQQQQQQQQLVLGSLLGYPSQV
jgi:hypothetical protein